MFKSRALLAVGVLCILALAGWVWLKRSGTPGAASRPSHGDLTPHAAPPTPGGSVMMYCAVALRPPVTEIAAAYERETGVRVEVQYGGSGTLLSNLQVSGLGDLFLAADASYIDTAEQKGLVTVRRPLAAMRPVIVVLTGNPLAVRTPGDLARPGLRVALGNPDAASIGRQTKTRLASAGLWDAVLANVERDGVFTPTVPEVANAVNLGAADAGVIWDAMVPQYPRLEAIPADLFDAAQETVTVGVLAGSTRPDAALAFAEYLHGAYGRAVFVRQGYSAPLEASTAPTPTAPPLGPTGGRP